ncbi:DUF445 family protein [bacterium]|nr:MAG: DUF445 family protein [bacterium]RIK60768.1 MAG: hypothetical protein DCC64_14255 [Planctomycetota bacterium]
MSEMQPNTSTPAGQAKGRGPLVLGLTGGVLAALTLAGAAFTYFWPQDLWSEIWFAMAISGLVGFGTNWIAIKMLFHPRVRLFGVQGVVPSRRADLARAVAATIEEHLISADRMHRLLVDTGAVNATLDSLTVKLPRLLEDPAARHLAHNEVRRMIGDAVNTVAAEARAKLKKKMRSTGLAAASGAAATAAFGPLAGLLAVGAAKSGVMDPVVDKVLNDMVDELQSSGALDQAAGDVVAAIPGAASGLLRNQEIRQRLTLLVSDASEDLLKAVDVRGLIEAELLAHDDAELEALIDRVASNELVFIQVIGGGLGMAAGLALVWPWLLAPFALAFGAAWALGRRAEKLHARARSAGSVRASIDKAQAAPAPAEPERLTEVFSVEAARVDVVVEPVAVPAK